MLGAMYSAITGMDAAATSMDAIGNNIANVSTTAYKSQTVSFGAIFSEGVSILGGHAGNEEGKGVQVVGLNSVWEQGALESTANGTDVCIQGDGFFRVVEDDGSAYYTRAGQFRYNDDYELVDPEGRIVQGFLCDSTTGVATTGAGTVVSIDTDALATSYSNISIASDGHITGETSVGTREYLYQIAVFDFPNIDGLRKVSGTMYAESTADSGAVTAGEVSGTNGAGEIHNNHLEMSNVDLAREFVNLIVSQKAFQANSRVISSSTDMLTEVINILR